MPDRPRGSTNLLGDFLSAPAAVTRDLLGDRPSFGQQIDDLYGAQKAALAQGGIRGMLHDPDVVRRATDVAGNLNFTGKVGGNKKDYVKPPPYWELPVKSLDTLENWGLGPLAKKVGSREEAHKFIEKSLAKRAKTVNLLDPPEDSFFDYSRLGERMDVPQRKLERPPPPPKGVPDYVLKAVSPESIDQMRGYVEKGLKIGGKDWYSTGQLKEKMTGLLGKEKGDRAFNLLMDTIAATSPQTKVPENVRNASFFYSKLMSGEGVPSKQQMQGRYPYGHYVMDSYLRNLNNIVEQGELPVGNPKIKSFGENLKGNLEPLTADIHNSRALDLRDMGGRPLDTPERPWYSAIEEPQATAAKEMGLQPAEWQAAAWVGAGDKTGLGSAPVPFLRIFEEVLDRTAQIRGMSKRDVFNQFALGKMPLFGLPPAAAAMARSMINGEQQDDGT